MSTVEKVLTYAKDLILITERISALSKTVGTLADRIDDHERRLIRIEALIEFSMRTRLPPVGEVRTPELPNVQPAVRMPPET